MTVEPYPDPTPEMLNGDPLFDAIWGAIKGWDISRHNDGLYAGPSGNDARHIYDAIRASQPPSPQPALIADAKRVAYYLGDAFDGEPRAQQEAMEVLTELVDAASHLYAASSGCTSDEISARLRVRNTLDRARSLVAKGD